MIEWNHPWPPATEETVSRFEAYIGKSLPPRYRQYLLAVNGGWTRKSVGFPIPIVKEVVMLGLLYSLDSRADSNDLENVFDDIEDVIPEGFLAVGEDPGGNLVLVKLEGDDREAVVFWDRRGILTRRHGLRLFPVAVDFDAFLASLAP